MFSLGVLTSLCVAKHEEVQRGQVGGFSTGWIQILVKLVSWAGWFLHRRPGIVGDPLNFPLYWGRRTVSWA